MRQTYTIKITAKLVHQQLRKRNNKGLSEIGNLVCNESGAKWSQAAGLLYPYKYASFAYCAA